MRLSDTTTHQEVYEFQTAFEYPKLEQSEVRKITKIRKNTEFFHNLRLSR